ncbi:MAG: DUF1499 domain-containing protein [Lentisphaeria bacterium]|nr:DUF1499 domain-containing protein [Lentisphaeria bacterium]
MSFKKKNKIYLIVFVFFWSVIRLIGMYTSGEDSPSNICQDHLNCASTGVEIPAIYYNPVERALVDQTLAGVLQSETSKLAKTEDMDGQTVFWHYIDYSLFWGFPDDVYIFLNNESSITFVSQSRFGKSDFGINKKRLQSIHKKLMDYPELFAEYPFPVVVP